MKKKTLSLLLALVVLCTLTACSKQETVTSSALADEAEQNIKETTSSISVTAAGAMKRQSSERTSSRQS